MKTMKLKSVLQWLSLVTAALANVAIAQSAHASGWSVGNGGHVWKCRHGGRVTYELLDHYEARTAHEGEIEDIRGDWKEIAKSKLAGMRAYAPGLTQEMLARIDRFEEDARFLEGHDVPLPFVNDSYNFISPRGCEMKQLALNRALVRLSTEKTYYIDKTIWDRLPDVQKAMTAVHEVLYTDSLVSQRSEYRAPQQGRRHDAIVPEEEQLNSVGVRALNAELFLNRLSGISRERWDTIAYVEAWLRVRHVARFQSFSINDDVTSIYFSVDGSVNFVPAESQTAQFTRAVTMRVSSQEGSEPLTFRISGNRQVTSRRYYNQYPISLDARLVVISPRLGELVTETTSLGLDCPSWREEHVPFFQQLLRLVTNTENGLENPCNLRPQEYRITLNAEVVQSVLGVYSENPSAGPYTFICTNPTLTSCRWDSGTVQSNHLPVFRRPNSPVRVSAFTANLMTGTVTTFTEAESSERRRR